MKLSTLILTLAMVSFGCQNQQDSQLESVDGATQTDENVGDTSCYERLLDGFASDSRSFHVMADLDFDMPQEEQNKILIERAIRQVGCEMSDLTIESITCRQIVEGSWSSEVCYITSQLGYFFVMKDMVDTANVVFNRWD